MTDTIAAAPPPLPPDQSFPAPGYPLDAVRELREHLLWLRLKGRSERTLACRRRALVRLAQHLGRDPWDASYHELYAWQIHLAGTSIEHMRWHTALIRPYYRWLHERGARVDNPAALLPCPAARRGLPRPMAEHKVMTMIATAPPRLLPWLILAAWCGLRAVEIAGLRREDLAIDERGRAWATVRGKGGGVRDVPIPAWAWPHITGAAAAHGPCWRRVQGFGAVTPKLVSQYCNAYLRSIGIADTLHSLRHRAATLALEQAGGDLSLVQDLLGHATPATTRIYTRVRPARMADVIDALPAPASLPHPAPARRLHVVGQIAPGGTA